MRFNPKLTASYRLANRYNWILYPGPPKGSVIYRHQAQDMWIQITTQFVDWYMNNNASN